MSAGSAEVADEAPTAGNKGLPLLEDLPELAGRRVLVRLDLNVPLFERPDGETVISDDFRIRATLPTLRYLRMQGSDVTVATHLGRPDGPGDRRYSVAPVAERLRELGQDVRVLENLRYSPGEAANSPEFVKDLVRDQDCYVDDAFGVMHRRHASVVGPPGFLPSAAGRLVEREMAAMSVLLHHPPRPFVVVIGGAKVADKISLLRSLGARADKLLVGGGMAFTFFAALGHTTGGSIVDLPRLGECRALLADCPSLVLPMDVLAESDSDSEARTFGRDIPDGWRGLDIGPETREIFCEEISAAGSILWNGPMGVFEDDRFAEGTRAVASALARVNVPRVVGGGDSAAAVDTFGLSGQVGHVSTGGGATLELFEFGDLPGLAALRESPFSRH